MKSLKYFFLPSLTVFGRNKGFAVGFIVLACCALTISSLIFRIYGLLSYSELPFMNSNEIVSVTAIIRSGDESTQGNTLVLANHLKNRLNGELSVLIHGKRKIRTDSEDLTVDVESVNGEYLSMLGSQLLAGESLDDYSNNIDPENVVAISYDFAKKIVPGNPIASLNHYISIDGVRRRIIGILDKDFQSPSDLSGQVVSAWIPFSLAERSASSWKWFNSNIKVIGRMPPNVELDEYSRHVELVTEKILKENISNIDNRAPRIEGNVVYLRNEIIGGSAKLSILLIAILILISAFSLTMLVSFWISRVAERRKELSIYAALGGSRKALKKILHTEAAFLCIASGVVATLVAFPINDIVVQYLSDYLPRAKEITPSVVLIFFGALSVFILTTFVSSGFVESLRSNLVQNLSSGIKGTISNGYSGNGLRSVIFCLQICIIFFAISIGSAFFIQVNSELREPVGYEIDAGSYIELDLPADMRSGIAASHFIDRIGSILSANKGVDGASMIRMPLATNALALDQVESSDSRDSFNVAVNEVQPDFFSNIGIRVLGGRPIVEADEQQHLKVTVISKSLAKRFGGEREALGKIIIISETPYEVVGVVDDIISPGQAHPAAKLQAYRPYQFVDGPGSLGMIVFHDVNESIDYRKVKSFIRTIPGAFLSKSNTLREMRSELTRVFYVKAGLAIVTLILTFFLVFYTIYLAILQNIWKERYTTYVYHALGANFSQLASRVLKQTRISSAAACIIFLVGVLYLSSVFISNALLGMTDLIIGVGIALFSVLVALEVIGALLMRRSLLWLLNNKN